MRVLGPLILVTAIVLGMTIPGWRRAERQRWPLMQFQQTSAVVTETSIERNRMGHYRPVVAYEYEAGGRLYRATSYRQFAPLPESGDQGWAQRQVEPFEPKQRTTAYYDPQNPVEVFLVRRVRLYPYVLILVPMVIAMAFSAALVQTALGGGEPVAGAAGPHDWYHIQSAVPAAGRAKLAGMGALVWYVYGLAAAWHYLLVAEDLRAMLPAAAFGAYGVLGLIPLVAAIRRMRGGARMADAEIAGTLPRFRTDGLVIIRYEQQAVEPVHIRSATVSLVCEHRRGLLGRERLFSSSFVVAENTVLVVGQRLSAEHSFEIPPKKRRPSSRGSRWNLPRTDWLIEVVVKFDRGRKYVGKYPILIEIPPRPGQAD